MLTCDDKGVFTSDDDTYRKHKQATVGRRFAGERMQRPGGGCDMDLVSGFGLVSSDL
jgi:hypothetical protein